MFRLPMKPWLLSSLHAHFLRTQLEISNQKRQLKMLVVFDLQPTCRVVIADVPNLHTLIYGGNLLDLSFMKKPPRLAQTELISTSFETPFPIGLDWRELFLKMSHIEMLSLNVPFFCTGRTKVIPQSFEVYVHSTITRMDGLLACKSLKELHFCTNPLDQTSLYAILYSLKHLTSLEKLCLSLETFKEYYHGNELRKDRVSQPPYMNLQYEMSRIKTITIIRFTGDCLEIQVANFVLRKAVSLESLILHPEEGKQISEKLQKALLQIPKASRTAQIKFSHALEEDDLCPRQWRLWQGFQNSN